MMQGLYHLPPGVDFAAEVVAGLRTRMAARPPEDMARVTLYANDGHTLRALRAAFDRGDAMLLPRLRLLADLGGDRPDVPPAAPLARRLELARLVEAMPGHGALGRSVPALSRSLAELMAEMQSEGLDIRALEGIDAADHAVHWQRALAFLRIAAGFYLSGPPVDRESRQWAAADRLAADWAAGRNLPDGPVIVAGSTGSHGASRRFMRAVAGLSCGAVILPGFDTDMPDELWTLLADCNGDHPQSRFAPLVAGCGTEGWTTAHPPDPARNRLVSLALRPPPVTDQWIVEGSRFGPLGPATDGLTLIEADHPGEEAGAIAVLIRCAVEQGTPVTLIASDRTLTRRVAAALDRWRILPDDSAGTPLPLTAAGLFLRQIAALAGRPLGIDLLLALLKHPVTATGAGEEARREHLLHTRNLELHLRRNGPAFPDGAALRAWGARAPRHAGGAPDPARRAWADWLAGAVEATLPRIADGGPCPLPARAADHRHLAELWAAGPGGTVEASELYAEQAGGLARAVLDHLAEHAGRGPATAAADFASLLADLLQGQAVRQDVAAHPLVRIRGPREARSQAVGLVILAGLNEGGWPQAPDPDCWLSRPMRRQAGLTQPERRIGLAAHDFQLGLAAERVVLTRARRNEEAETVPSRWLNRLLNLLGGLPGQGGPQALAAMRGRGRRWLDLAAALAVPPVRLPPEPRPSPVPPAPALRELSVTQVGTLIRDPYAIYARKVLRLEPLSPLRPEPDAADRGTVLHEIVRRHLTPAPCAMDSADALRERLLSAAEQVLAEQVPWPSVRMFWHARIRGIAGRLARDERDRLQTGGPLTVETRHHLGLPGLAFTLTAKPDRIDRLNDGRAVVYDYKSGKVPSQSQMERFDKQLPLEAVMAQRGAFGPPMEVAALYYIRLGGDGETVGRDCSDALIGDTWDGFVQLIAAYLDGRHGFTARLAMERTDDMSDYDHLSRYGEWTAADPARRMDLGDA